MLGNFFNKGKCAVGLHAGEWQYVTDGACSQTRTCTRCNAESTRVEHTMSVWEYIEANQCNQKQTCTRCGKETARTAHTWGPARYRSENDCNQIHTCTRCGQQQNAGTQHVNNLWEYTSGETCTQTLICSRCKTAETDTRVTHNWGDWQFSETKGTIRICRRCGEINSRVAAV